MRRLLLASLALLPLAARSQGAADLLASHPGSPGRESSRALLAAVDAMKAELAGREKPLEILLALGNLYYDNGRYLDAIDEYRQALALAEPGLASLEALPREARAARPSEAARRGCARTRGRGYAELAGAAQERARGGELADAAFCWRAALVPAIEAQARRGSAWFLAGNPDQGVAEEEAVLARDPGNADALFTLGAILYETGGDDPGKLRRARDCWRRFQVEAARDPRRKVVAERLPRLEQLLRSAAVTPPRRS